MPSIAAIDRRCFVAPPRTRPESRPPQDERAPRWSASFAMTCRPPQARVKTRA